MFSYCEFIGAFRELIRERDATCDEDAYALNCVRDKQIKLCCEYMSFFIKFLDEDCTGDEYGLLSEIYEDVAATCPNREYVASLYRAVRKFPKETEDYRTMSFVEGADIIVKSYLDDEPDSEEQE